MGVPGSAAVWLALFLTGQLATLLLIDAGPRVGYQHYPPLLELFRAPHTPWLALFGLELLAVVWGISRSRAALTRMGRSLGGPGLLLVVAAFVLTSATLSKSPARYAGELVFASLVQLVHLGCLWLVVASLNQRQLAATGTFVRRLLGPPDDERVEPGGPDRLIWGLAIGVSVVAALLAVFVYQRHPHVPDEVVYLLHARYFAAGQLALPLPPVPEAFNVDLMTYQATRWFSPVPPGWPAILAIGAFFGAPWLVNPLLGGINIVLSHSLLRELYPRRTARIATILLAISPWHLFLAMSFMNHTATLACALAAALAVARLRRDPRPRWALLGGLFLGVVGLIRPLDGLSVALVLGPWSLGARGRRVRLGPALALTFATLATAALVLPYNRALTGSARVFPIMQYADALYGPGTNDLGFGKNRGLGWPGVDPFPGHGAIDVAVNADLNLFQTNVELFGWATGSLLLIAYLVGAGRLRGPDRGLLAALGFTIAMQSLYWFSGGPDFGARYWFFIIVPCVALSARGLEEAAALAETGQRGSGTRVFGAAAIATAGSLFLFMPWRSVDKYYHYRGMRPDVRQLAARQPFGNSVVLIRGRRFPDYASAVAYNPMRVTEDRPLFAWDQGAVLRRQLVDQYPGRSFWIVAGATQTGRGAEVVAGPLSGMELLRRADSLPPP